MRILIFILLSINSLFLVGQNNLPIDSITKKITFSEVVDIIGTKEQIHSKAREWFAKSYKSSNDVIQMDDKESGKIIAKPVIHFVLYVKGVGDVPIGYIYYTISVFSKDNKYKFEITDFYHLGKGECPDYNNIENMIHSESNPLSISKQKTYSHYIKKIDEDMKIIIASLKSDMKKNSNQDW